MQCIESRFIFEETIKKSRFIGVLSPCRSESEFHALFKNLQSDYPDASHIAFAYRLKTEHGFISRMHDAGEPSGTAGKPIFQHLEGKQLMNAMLAVIRYFGGIKLGAGGLSRTYGNTAKKVIECAELRPYIEWIRQDLQLEYRELQSFEHYLHKIGGEISEQYFGELIRLSVRLPEQNMGLLSEHYRAKFMPG